MTTVKTSSVIFQQDPYFPLRVAYQIQEPTDFHSHEFIEIVIIMKGKGEHRTLFAHSEVSAGDILVIPRNGVHCYQEIDGLELINVLSDPRRLPLPLLDLYQLPAYHALFELENSFFESKHFYPSFHLNADQFSLIQMILQEMQQESTEKKPGYRCCLMGYFVTLLGKLCRLIEADDLKQSQMPFWNIGKVMGYLNANYHKKITLDDILAHVPMSKSAFLRHFKDASGYSPIEYLIKIRIGKAAVLLKTKTISISNAAHQSGFTDSNYFTRCFTKIMGYSPSDYRKEA